MFTINGQIDPVTNSNNELYSSPPIPILVNSPTLPSTSQQSDSTTRKTAVVDSPKINLQLDTQKTPQYTGTTTSTTQTNMDDFEIKQPIGHGSSAMVYSAIYLPYNKRVAIKVIDLDMFERNQIDELRRETALMALSKHPHVLRVYGSFVHGSKLYIVTPYMAVGSCLDIMKLSFPNGLDEISIATILKQALDGLAYLHKNGHIHRDVKAGNLLMDEDGSVLLADFGVSSSLMETGERGVRKTFVGTPCWMAPEVMEQADYDYKADIWSFGITAIELATGHAPFAKHPPLKVLMMTLNNDPPTLARETNTNKYSRIFKEMIDLCMNKDPAKRPSSEKLLLHPFFKQAKKPEWLSKNLITDIPPIESRPIKKFPQKQATSTRTDEWDFNDHQQESQSYSNQQPLQMPALHAPKRHISFGHVVVRKPSAISHHHASESWSYSSNHHPHSFITDSQPVPPLPLGPSATKYSPPPRKERALSDDFLIEQSRIPNSRHHHQGSAPPGFPNDDASKRGRFDLNRGLHYERVPTVTFSEETGNIRQQPSNDKKTPRFHNPPTESSPPLPLHLQAGNFGPLSRRDSNVTSSAVLTRENSAHSRRGSGIARLDDSFILESRKIGRFELTSNESSRQHSMLESTKDESSPYSTHSDSYSSSSQSFARGQSNNKSMPIIYSQLDELLKQNDSQRQMLNDLFNMFETSKGYSSSAETRSDQQQELVSTIDSLEQQLQGYQRENLLLQRENETMRRQIDQLKNHPPH